MTVHNLNMIDCVEKVTEGEEEVIEQTTKSNRAEQKVIEI